MHRPPRHVAHEAVKLARQKSASAHKLRKYTIAAVGEFAKRAVRHAMILDRQTKVAAHAASINGITLLLREDLPPDQRLELVARLQRLTDAVCALADGKADAQPDMDDASAAAGSDGDQLEGDGGKVGEGEGEDEDEDEDVAVGKSEGADGD